MVALETIKGDVNLLKLKAYKHRGDIAFIGGTGLTMVGTGLFVRATFKNQPVLQKHKDDMAKLNEEYEAAMYEENVYKKEKSKICRTTVKGTVKNYILPAAISAAGYGAQGYAVCSYKSDMAGLSVALSGSVAALEAVRQKIIEKEGEDAAAEYFDGIHVDDIYDDETKEVSERKVIFDEENPGRFSFLFYQPNPNFSPYKFANLNFITTVYNAIDRNLPTRRAILLSEVLDALGFDGLQEIKISKLNPACGFVYKNLDGSIRGVSFGLEAKDEATQRFINGDEAAFMLRFNCVDNIYNYI